MHYLDFQNSFKNFTVFSIADIRQVEPGFYRRRLSEWQEKGYIKKIIKGYYIFSGLNINEKVIFEIANRIYSPSYISFEMALAYYGLIPESVYGITCASTRKTSHFKTPVGDFFYRTIRPKLYFGFELLKNNEKLFKLASPEKAFLDFFYIKTELRDTASFREMRVNHKVFRKLVSRSKMNDYLAAYGQKSLKRRIDNFWEYITHA
jgi:predicted transcriptional regulator of viral defense system